MTLWVKYLTHEECSPVALLVLVGIVEAERSVDGRALRHELDGTPRVGRYVADRQHSMRKCRRSFLFRHKTRIRIQTFKQ